MNIKYRVKKLSLLTAIATALLGASSSNVWAKTNLPELQKELQIMSSIMQTSLLQSTDKKGIKLRGIDVTYLSGQGVVFELTSSAHHREFAFSFNSDGGMPEIAPIPPLPPLPIAGDHDQNVFIEFDDEQWSEVVEESLRLANGAISEAREKLRELHHQEREFAWEEREYKRRLRDIEFEMRSADAEHKERLNEQKAELEAEIAELKKRQKDVDKYSKQLEAEQKQQAEQKLAQRKQQYSAFLSHFEDNVASTLCKYGNGIKALPDDENVSFILSKLGSAEKSGAEDRIYVFKNKDIQSCVKDKMSPKQLLSNAEAYMF
ncbi:hypothetical protein [Aliiglaciecola lipolytica]|uniref:Uncharacterized protein n=1 Tax=Aliiglaciecola lipolytica E3 TaxID=1127673 RepID=K6YBW3_9ALTE|nr:hypothetical protein [Aliiglaciecola lipolytica]GAC15692.1 hypothetical protein GLIP_3071 [Aliiglaciecola lipolytica E3]